MLKSDGIEVCPAESSSIHFEATVHVAQQTANAGKSMLHETCDVTKCYAMLSRDMLTGVLLLGLSAKGSTAACPAFEKQALHSLF